MADRGRWTANTDNEAVVIANLCGRHTPDTFGTDDQDKFGDAHPSAIHDPYERYGDSPISDPC
jgi:hypothetical protein